MKFISCFLLLAVVSCNQQTAKNFNKSAKVSQLADRTCHAITIRQERFALANKIRFAGDSLAALKGKNDTMRFHDELKVYLKQKDSLLKASLALADTIHKLLDSLMPYTDKAGQKRFTAALDSTLKARGCEVTTKEDNIPHEK